MRLIQTSAPAVEPVSLEEAKLFCRVDISDDDDLITSLIGAAREVVETELRQSLITQTWQLYLDSFPSAGGYYNRAIREVWPSLGGLPGGIGFYPGLVPNSTGVIDIPNPPLQSITSVQYYDFQGTLQTFSSSLYNVSLKTPARIQPAYSQVWPIARPTIDSVIITYVAGYGSDSSALPKKILTAMKMLITHWYDHRDAVSADGYAEIPLAVQKLLASADHGSYA